MSQPVPVAAAAVQIRPRLCRAIAGDDIFAKAGQGGHEAQGRRVDNEGFLARFAVGQEQDAALEIDFGPPKMEDLA